MNTKALLLDCDGVVISKGHRFSETLAREHGISTATTRSFFENEFQECLIGARDLKCELGKYIYEWGWKEGVENFLEYWFKSEHHIDERVIRTILQLKHKGVPCYLATDNEKYRTEYITEIMGFGKIFDAVFSSSAIGYKKSQPEFFGHLMYRLEGVNAAEVMFWDDDIRNVKVAHSVGITAEVYKDFESFEEKLNSWFNFED